MSRLIGAEPAARPAGLNLKIGDMCTMQLSGGQTLECSVLFVYHTANQGALYALVGANGVLYSPVPEADLRYLMVSG